MKAIGKLCVEIWRCRNNIKNLNNRRTAQKPGKIIGLRCKKLKFQRQIWINIPKRCVCVNRCERSSSNPHRQSLNSRSLLYSRCNQALYCRSSSGSDWPEVKSFEFRSSDCSHFRLLPILFTLPPVGNCVADDSLRASKIEFISNWQKWN